MLGYFSLRKAKNGQKVFQSVSSVLVIIHMFALMGDCII